MRIAPIDVIDSHTAGEPTRVVVGGWPMPRAGTIAECRDMMREEQDHIRRAVVLEPRGHDAVVGALLLPPERSDSVAGVVFFNDVSYLGMCGHGLMGVVRTLEHLGRISAGEVLIDTPVGQVGATLDRSGSVTVRNVRSYRHLADVQVDVEGIGAVRGDVAWGGNWFFLTTLDGIDLTLSNRAELLRVTTAIREALHANGITGADGAFIDHVECFGPPVSPDADSRNFVLCPGSAYDRSPCGTGTSAKMATLHARGLLPLDTPWRQEGIVGSIFTGWLADGPQGVMPHVRGEAFVTARATLLFDAADPFATGLPG